MANVVLSFMNGLLSCKNLRMVPCFYESFAKGLVDAGNNVLIYHTYGYKPPSENHEKLQSEIRGFKPDLIIAFNNFGPDYSKICECPILIYEVDSPLFYSNQDIIAATPLRYSYCVSQETSRRIIQEKFKVPSNKIGLAPFFTEVRAEDKEKKVNISFIGSRFLRGHASFHWNWYISPVHSGMSHMDIRFRQRYMELLDIVRENPFVTAEDLSAKFGDMGLNDEDISNLIGSLSSEKRIQTLTAIADLGLELYGPVEWLLDSSGESAALHCSYNMSTIYSLRQNQDLYNSSKICLNVNHLQAIEGYSWRVCDIMASSGCLVSEYRPNLKKFFPDIPIPTFTNQFEAREQCVKLLKDESLRKDISLQCQEAVEQRFRFRHILPIIENLSGVDLHSGAENCFGASAQFIDGFSDFIDVSTKSRSSLFMNCIKLAICQIPGCRSLFKQEKLFAKIEKYKYLQDYSRLFKMIGDYDCDTVLGMRRLAK